LVSSFATFASVAAGYLPSGFASFSRKEESAVLYSSRDFGYYRRASIMHGCLHIHIYVLSYKVNHMSTRPSIDLLTHHPSFHPHPSMYTYVPLKTNRQTQTTYSQFTCFHASSNHNTGAHSGPPSTPAVLLCHTAPSCMAPSRTCASAAGTSCASPLARWFPARAELLHKNE